MKITVSVEKAREICQKRIERIQQYVEDSREKEITRWMSTKKQNWLLFSTGDFYTREEAVSLVEEGKVVGDKLFSDLTKALFVKMEVQIKVDKVLRACNLAEDGKITLEDDDI